MFFFYSCNVSSTESETKELLNTIWVLESFEVNGEVIIPPKEQIYNIQFRADSMLTGQSDCNEIGGKYSLGSNNSIKVFDFGTTKIYCGKDSKGNEYSTAISEIHSYNINYDKLFLYYNENSKMIFNKE